MPYAELKDLNLYYELEGSGPRVLLLNGRGGDLSTPRYPFRDLMSERFTVLAYDHRGQGRSDNPEDPCNPELLAQDATALLDFAGWRECSVIGPSMGGFVAQYMAALYPERVTKLVLLVTYPGGKEGKRFPVYELEELPSEEYVARNMNVLDTRWDAAWQKANVAIVEQFAAIMAAQKKVREADPALMRSYMNQLSIASSLDTTALLPKIKTPTLIISGRFDGLLPAENAPLMTKLIPGARYELIDHGHISWAFDKAVAEKVIAFIKE